MGLTVTVKKQVKVKTLDCFIDARYWEDATVNGVEDTDGHLIPCRLDKTWRPTIELQTGKILNWQQGVTASIHYKVCDAGQYDLLDEDGNVIASHSGYVPKMLCPKENGYGDYIIMDILEDGTIVDFEPNFEIFEANNDN